MLSLKRSYQSTIQKDLQTALEMAKYLKDNLPGMLNKNRGKAAVSIRLRCLCGLCVIKFRIIIGQLLGDDMSIQIELYDTLKGLNKACS